MTTTIGIVGSRAAVDYAAFCALLSEITASWTFSSEHPLRIVSGGAAAHDGVLIAMPGPKSRGTWDTVRRCKKLGVKVIVREVPE